MLKAALAEHTARLEVAGSLDEALSALAVRRFDLILAEGATLAEGDDPLAGVGRLRTAIGGARLAILWGGAADRAPDLLARGASLVAQKPLSTFELVAALQGVFADDSGERTASAA